MKIIFIYLIRFYQKFISPLFPATCRYYPTCSQYSLEAFREFGVFKGFYLSVKRILKCNPFFRGGFDPIPTKNCAHSPRRIKFLQK